MPLNSVKSLVERRHECMAQLAKKELIAELRGQKELVIKWDLEHKRCAKEVVEMLELKKGS